MKEATINQMPTSARGHPERNLIDGRQFEGLRSHEITNKHKVHAVPATKPYAGEKSAPQRNSEVPEIKPFNNGFVPGSNMKPLPDVPQTNHARKYPLQPDDNRVSPASILSGPNMSLQN
jgi:hypothetical protein